MTQIKIKNLDKFNAQLRAKLTEAIKDKSLLEEIGANSLKHVKASLQLGNDAETGKKHAKKLSPSYKKKKKQIIETNAITNEFSRYINNLSGQLAESLNYQITPNKSKLSIFAVGEHTPYKNADGTDMGSAIPNSQLLKWLNEQRKILGLTQKKKKELVELLARHLRRLLK